MSGGSEHRVIRFRADTKGAHRDVPSPPVADLGKYQRGKTEEDDYRHRMIVNIGAFVFIIALIGAGLWIADTMAEMRKNQDCVLSGRSGCTHVDYKRDRW